MADTHCEELGWWLTSAMNTPEVADILRQLRAGHAPLKAVVAALATAAPRALAQQIEAEFAELPRTTMAIIIDAWAMANEGGRRFEVRSVRPDRPVEFARKSRVRVAVEAEDDGVTVLVSHIASRHADWYAPRVVTLAPA